MRKHVPGVVHSIAFTLDGQRLWCAHRDQIAVRAWPSLELLALHPLATTRLVATVDGTFLAACVGRVVEVDDNAAVVRVVDVDRVVALGLDDDGAVVVARAPANDPRAIAIERHAHDGRRTPLHAVLLTRGVPWWMTLLPTKKALVIAVDDHPPAHVDYAIGVARAEWDWLPQWTERKNAPMFGTRRSWLSVDAATDERCFLASDKGQGGTVVWLDGIGRITRYVSLERRQRAPTPEELAHGRFFMKGPSRGAASTFHPHEDIAVTVDISGRVLVNDADTGGLNDVVDAVFDAGYRWG